MKKTTLSKLKKGDLFKSHFGNDLYEVCFFVRNAGGYGSLKDEGTSAWVIKRSGFGIAFEQFHRADKDEIYLIEDADRKYLSEAEDRIKQTIKYTELYKDAEQNTDGENLLGTYQSSAEYGEKNFKRGDLVEDPYGRIGVVLGVDGHSIKMIKRVDYRVQVTDGKKKGTGIFRADELKKVGEMDDISNIED